MTIPLSSIDLGDRERKVYHDIEELADSIKTSGLIQPIVLTKTPNDRYLLVAGGRRYRALLANGVTELWHGTSCDPLRPGYVFRSEVTDEATLKELELLENLQRDDFDWREMVSGFCKLHRMWRQAAVLRGEPWHHQHTADRIGYSRTYVTDCLTIEPKLNDPAYKDCDSLFDAMRVYGQENLDAITAEQARRTLTFEPQTSNVSCEEAVHEFVTSLDHDIEGAVNVAPVVVPLSKMLYNADCLHWLTTLPPESVDHCITDWPYAIDVDYLQQSKDGLTNFSRIRDTHDVDSNLALHSAVIPLIYRVLRPDSFFITWLDIMTWQRTYDLLVTAGFRVQRWPFIGHKTYLAGNSMAEVNFPKNYEMAIIARKGKALLTEVQLTSIVPMERSEYSSNPFAKHASVWTPLINACSLAGQTILDPFAGEGSCCVSALSLGRSILACELDSTHYPYLVRNVSNFYRSRLSNVSFI